MLERTLVALFIIGVGLAVYLGWTRLGLARKGRHSLGLPGYRPGRPAVLYFTTPGCLPCETVQRPALSELMARWDGRLQVLEVDALAHPELADSWGVLAVPTTFVIDSAGRPRRVNHGVARSARLASQLAEIGEGPPALKDGLEEGRDSSRPAEREAQWMAPTEEGTE